MVGIMVFYLLTPRKIEAHEYQLYDFLADDLLYLIQSPSTKIATDKKSLDHLKEQYPRYHKYKVEIGKF
jgi:hypothetical protein